MYEVIARILKFCMKPSCLHEIISKSGTSGLRVKEFYLPLLLKCRLLVKDSCEHKRGSGKKPKAIYRTSGKGTIFLEWYRRVEELISN